MATRNSARATKVPRSKSDITARGKKLPLNVLIRPDMPAARLIEDLSSVGLELGRDKEGNHWLRRTDKLHVTPHSKIGHLDAIAKTLDVPLWVLMIPDMPPELLKEAAGLVQLVQSYVSAEPLRRIAIDRFMAPQGSLQAPTDEAGSATRSLEERIEDQRNEMFGAMAIVAVARDSIDKDDNYDLARALEAAYSRFYQIAGELNNISVDAKEVRHG